MGGLRKCSPFYWIPPLRRVPGWVRVLVWIGLVVVFYLSAPETLGKMAGSLLGFLCCPGLIVLGVYAIAKAPKGETQAEDYARRAEKRERSRRSQESDRQWFEDNDSRNDFTSKDYEG